MVVRAEVSEAALEAVSEAVSEVLEVVPSVAVVLAEAGSSTFQQFTYRQLFLMP